MLANVDWGKEQTITGWACISREIRKRNDVEYQERLSLAEAKLCLPPPIEEAPHRRRGLLDPLLVDKLPLSVSLLPLTIDKQPMILIEELTIDKQPMILIEEEEAKLCIFPAMDEKVINPSFSSRYAPTFGGRRRLARNLKNGRQNVSSFPHASFFARNSKNGRQNVSSFPHASCFCPQLEER